MIEFNTNASLIDLYIAFATPLSGTISSFMNVLLCVLACIFEGCCLLLPLGIKFRCSRLK